MSTNVNGRCVVAFDLDGTVCDSSEGIINSINYALERLGQPTRPAEELITCVGPKLVDSFARLLPESIPPEAGARLYSERYSVKGFRENRLYPGICDVLETLWSMNIPMFTATAKSTRGTLRTLNHFGITHYFREARGCDSGVEKHDLLCNAKAKCPGARVIMVGDRSFDMIAAKSAGCLAVGALWGYGSEIELREAGADVLVGQPSLIMKHLEPMC
ncbi:hydrolase [Desulfoluna limicola]|uniref:Hydrolase n=1 Tax=Desulfoluna limicola TaxID=2810562 RepID=A0ABN6F348_9BACT|nr:HAD hydrolase-like protein [Desulfoluna limicola]BCS95897.1 hydrolase [Desulfoluna limicola]